MADMTKQALEASLKRLLLTKPVTKITINDIAEDCGISRGTFYYHFQDIYDLVEWTTREDARRVLEGNRFFLDERETDALFLLDNISAADLEHAFASADGAEARAAEAAHRKAMAWRKWHLARPHKPKLLGCHFSLFKEDAERVNGFDENFTGWGYEDDDFARRLYRAGVEPESVILQARALHLFHPSEAPKTGTRHRDRPNRAYFRRWVVPVRCRNGLAGQGGEVCRHPARGRM